MQLGVQCWHLLTPPHYNIAWEFPTSSSHVSEPTRISESHLLGENPHLNLPAFKSSLTSVIVALAAPGCPLQQIPSMSKLQNIHYRRQSAIHSHSRPRSSHGKTSCNPPSETKGKKMRELGRSKGPPWIRESGHIRSLTVPSLNRSQ